MYLERLKVKFLHSTGQRESRFTGLICLVSELDVSWWSLPRPGCISHGIEIRYPIAGE